MKSNKSIGSEIKFKNKYLNNLLIYTQTLRDPNLVSKFQNYFGVHLISNDYNLKTEPEDKATNKSVNYVIENQFWYYLFRFGAVLGYESFAHFLFAFWLWNIDLDVGRRLSLVVVIIMYFGQALKDLVQWSRPKSPPVVVLEPEYSAEFGMPSTHAISGLAMPTLQIIFTINRYEYSLINGLIFTGFAIFWCLLVCGSRLYLGMHTILDIMAGLLLSTVLMTLITPFADCIDHFLLTNPFSPIFIIFMTIFLDRIFPKLGTGRWSPTRGETCAIISAEAGMFLGYWLNLQLGLIEGPTHLPLIPIIWPNYSVILICIYRILIGIICLQIVRKAVKFCAINLLCFIQNLNPNDSKNLIRVSVEIPCKLLTYLCVGLTGAFVPTVVFRYLNIEK